MDRWAGAYIEVSVIKLTPYILPNHRKTMILSASTLLASACCFYSDLSVLCMVVVEENVLSLQRMFISVNAGVGQCSLPSPNPTDSSYQQLHECYTP